MKRKLLAALGICLLTITIQGAILAQDSNNAKRKPDVVQNKAKPRTGEQVFNDNCYRCHTPPMSIPPRITGTIVMHMRTRARLSRADEELLLKYLAP